MLKHASFSQRRDSHSVGPRCLKTEDFNPQWNSILTNFRNHLCDTVCVCARACACVCVSKAPPGTIRPDER